MSQENVEIVRQLNTLFNVGEVDLPSISSTSTCASPTRARPEE
jgi:hypothetical protein